MNLVQHILLALVRLYRMVISPAFGAFFGPTGGCRFTPTCSVYAADAIRGHGAVRGSWLATKRLCRCHPWGGHGHDPVPEKKFPITETKSTPLPSSLRYDATRDAMLLGRQVVQAGKAVTSHRTPYSKTQPFAASSSTVI